MADKDCRKLRKKVKDISEDVDCLYDMAHKASLDIGEIKWIVNRMDKHVHQASLDVQSIKNTVERIEKQLQNSGQ